MTTILFVPVKTAMMVLCWMRMALSLASITWISLHNPEAAISGHLGHLMTQLGFPDSTYLNLIIPGLATEVLIDMLFLIGVAHHSRPWLVPWLVINSLMFLCFILTILYNVVPLFIDIYLSDNVIESPANKTIDVSEAFGHNHHLQNSLNEIERLLRILSMNMMSCAQLMMVSGGIKLFLDMRYKRRISFSKKIEKKEVPSSKASYYIQDKDQRIDNKINSEMKFPDIEESLPIYEEESRSLKMMSVEEEGSRSDSWSDHESNTVMFNYDRQDNFQ